MPVRPGAPPESGKHKGLCGFVHLNLRWRLQHPGPLSTLHSRASGAVNDCVTRRPSARRRPAIHSPVLATTGIRRYRLGQCPAQQQEPLPAHLLRRQVAKLHFWRSGARGNRMYSKGSSKYGQVKTWQINRHGRYCRRE